MKITKALITAAGRGTRFLPTVKAYPKELVPILNKPQIQYLVEELIGAGITDICIVHRHGDNAFKRYFTPDSELEDYLAANGKQAALDSLRFIWSHASLKFIPQPRHLPYGNASPALAAKGFLGTDPFIFRFGDDLTVEDKPGAFLTKMIATLEKYQAAVVIGVKKVPPEEISRYGSAEYVNDPQYPNRIIGMHEKLPASEAPSLFGQAGHFVYAANKLLPVLMKQSVRANELWLADANNTLAATDIVLTEAFDDQSDWLTTGDPLRWLKANITLGCRHPEMKSDLLAFLRDLT